MKKLFIILCLLFLHNLIFAQIIFGFDDDNSIIPKLEYILTRLYKDFQSVKKVNVDFVNEKKLIVVNEKVKIEAMLKDKNDISKLDLESLGVEKDDYFGVYENIVQMLIPVENLKALSENPFVAYVRTPVNGIVDEVIVSEGVLKINADEFHNAGYTGRGAKIAIIDLGFYNYKSLLGTELPNDAIIKSFFNSIYGNGNINGNNQSHGTAVAEIVYDVAPDAQLYFINMNSITELNEAVDYCIRKGVHIINHSIAWLQNSFHDGTGRVCSIAKKAFENNILWINSAGNYRKKHYRGEFYDPDSDNLHNFFENDNFLEIKNVQSEDTIEVILTWNEWDGSSNDYAILLYYDDSGDKIEKERSKEHQTGTQPPTESISYGASVAGTYYIAIKNIDADGKAIFNIISPSHELEFVSQENSYSYSIVDPAVGLNVLAVGSTFNTQDVMAPFSSEGPTSDGRIKPDICAPSYVSNKTYGKFAGTSASAPHVAGAAGLLFEEKENPNLTNLDLKTTLEFLTVDLGEVKEKNNIYGSGLLSLSLSTPVPVKISYFDVYAYNESEIILRWETLSETNNFGFEIEKSKDKLNWRKIGFIKGNGTTSSENPYIFYDNENSAGKYYYRLKQIDFDGSYQYSQIIELKTLIPEKWEIEQNFPNPFNAETIIRYKIPKYSFVSLKIYNILGIEVKTLVNEPKQPGNYYVKWDGKNDASIDLPSGIYFYEIKTKEFHKIKKMILLL